MVGRSWAKGGRQGLVDPLNGMARNLHTAKEEEKNMVEELLQDERYRSRRFLFAAFVLGFASLIVLAVVAAHVAVFVLAMTATPPPLMPVLWWWLSAASGVLTLYGLNKVADVLAMGKGG